MRDGANSIRVALHSEDVAVRDGVCSVRPALHSEAAALRDDARSVRAALHDVADNAVNRVAGGGAVAGEQSVEFRVRELQ